MKNILILGATSTIAVNCARIWASQGCTLFLAGRDPERLDILCADLAIRGAGIAGFQAADLSDVDQHASLLARAEAALQKFDLVFIAYGTLPSQRDAEANANLAIEALQTNGVSIVALSLTISNILMRQGEGVLAVISSVAGDRGRSSNYVYGSAKALVTAFLSGLRQRLHSHGISVITIKPGFIDTAMTADFDKGILWTSADKAARLIVSGIERKKDVLYVPGFWKLIMIFIGLLPERTFKRLRL